MKVVFEQVDAILGPRHSKLWWLSVVVMGAFWVLIGLGTWQVQRLNWKQHVIDTIEARIALEPVPLPTNTSLDLDTWEYRLVSLDGLWLHDKEVHLYTGPKVMRGKPGYDVFTPLLVADQKVVMVDRGWVPAPMKKQSDRQESVEQASATGLIGMIHKTEQQAAFTPENDILKNVWFWADVPSMLRSVKGHNNELNHFYVRAVATDEVKAGTYPIAGDTTVHYRNDHLQYAITWYSLAVILIFVYVALRKQLLGVSEG